MRPSKRERGFWLAVLGLILAAPAAWAQFGGSSGLPGPAGTAYTLDWLNNSADAATARSKLQIAGTNVSLLVASNIDNTQLATNSGTLSIKAGAAVTFPAIKSSSTNTVLSFTNLPAVSGGDLILYFYPQTNRVFISFGEWNSGANIVWNPFHSGGRGELQFTADSFAFGPGWECANGVAGVNTYRDMQIGIGEGHRARQRMQYDHIASAANPSGWSIPLVWTMYFWSNSTATQLTPGIQAQSGAAETGLGGLRFYANAHDSLSGTNWDWATWGYMGGPMQQGDQRLGWDLRGKLVQERTNATASAASYALDFNSAARWVDATVTAANVALYTTNAMVGSTNGETKVWLLRAKGLTVNLTYPWNWNTNGAGLPASITPSNMLRLELETLSGPGESNVNVVSVQTLRDNTYIIDPEAAAFFTRASITDAGQQTAINNLVTSLKQSATAADGNLWNKFTNGFLYPFVGGNATAHSKNLASNAFNITWAGSVTHGSSGVKSDGSSGYGDTGLTPSTAPLAELTNVFLYVYAATNGAADLGRPIGGTSTMRAGIQFDHVFGGDWRDDGMMDGAAAEVTRIIGTAKDAGVALWRTNATTKIMACTDAGLTTAARASTGLLDVPIYVLARNSGGAGNFWAAWLKFAAFGRGMTSTEFDAFAAIIEKYQTDLARAGLN